MPLRQRALALCGFVFLASCGGQDGAATTAPPPPAPGTVGPVAQSYLNEVIGVMQANSVNRKSIDWTDFRQRVLADAASAGAQTIAQTYPAIRVALGLLGDGHTTYTTSGGAVLYVPNRTCSGTPQPNPSVPGNVGYVRVTAFVGSGAAGNQFATNVQAAIRASDRDGLVGWMVDLRGNSGGNMWPMIAGLGPVLGEGTVGYFVDPDGKEDVWAYSNGISFLSGFTVATVTPAYTLRAPNPRVAVLIDGLVASSGEATTIAFKGRPNTRFFGTATCGLSTANAGFNLSDGANLNLTVATMADRNKVTYGGRVSPEESIPDNNQLILRAVEWLQTGH